ncbi:MAG: polysaccharide deacetylase family protein [Actinomycetales bacterium]|nr:polysaccharide deacetylase family protein [Actinomycetales bacterium]
MRRLLTTLTVTVTALAASAATAVGPAAGPAAAASCTGYVALTFDDGPNSGNTTTLLNTLRSAGARATLFNIGQNAAANPSLVQAERAAGMWVQNHSYTHPHMTSLSQSQMSSELSRTQSAIQNAGGGTPTLFRPPYGETNATLQAAASALGLRTVTWDVDSQDWNGASTSAIVQAASRLQNGQIMLMHDQYATTIAAIPQIVSSLAARGLCPGMISASTGRAVAPDGTTVTTGTTTTTRSTSQQPTTTRTTTTSGGGGAGTCTASYTVASQWPGGFVANVNVSAGGSAINGWRVTLVLPGGASIASLWNGIASGNSGTVTVTNQSYNGRLGAGQSASFGFQGTGTGAGASVTCTAT